MASSATENITMTSEKFEEDHNQLTNLPSPSRDQGEEIDERLLAEDETEDESDEVDFVDKKFACNTVLTSPPPIASKAWDTMKKLKSRLSS